MKNKLIINNNKHHLEILASGRREEKEIKAWVGQEEIKFRIYKCYDLATQINLKNLLKKKKTNY